MMKLTVAFLAALAAADASHGRRHQARQYGYGDNTPVYPPMNSTSAVESSTVLPEEASSSSSAGGYEGYPTYEGTGVPTGPATGASSVPSSTAEAEAETAFSSTGTGVYPTGTGYPTGEELVTSTIYSTQIITKTVSSSVILETTVVPVGTTICSKGEIPESTGLPVVSSGASEVVIASKTPVSEITHTMTQTIVYTIGVSSSAHAQTQLIPTTSTETIYSTVYITKPVGGSYEETTAAADTPTGTTTISSTSTTTKYVTVPPSSGSPVPEAQGEGEGCAGPVTVTVTAQETVTVTAGYETPESSTVEGEDTITSTFYNPYSSSAVPTAPYPVSNSTVVGPTGGSTGFVTYTKTSGSTGAVLPTGGYDTALPSFSFTIVPEEESTTAAPEEATSSSAAATSSAAGYNGYDTYRRFRLF